VKIDKETGRASTRSNLVTEVLRRKLGGRQVDVVVAGVPCQGFSLCNRKRSIHDERNYLFLYFVGLG